MSDTEVIENKRAAKAGPAAQPPQTRQATLAPARKATAANRLSGRKVWIKIPKTKTEFRDVAVGHNFIMYQIKRGVEVEVPEEVVHALELAVSMELTETEDPVSRRIIYVPVETQSVPFMVVRGGQSAPRAEA